MDILLEQIEVDIEYADYNDVETYGEIITGLQKIFKEKFLSDLINAYNKLKEAAENWYDFEMTREEILSNTGDEYLAEDIAWELVFA